MTIQRARELMTIERECVKQANTCGRDCAKCDLVQDDKELLDAYETVQLALITLEHFRNAIVDITDYCEEMEGETELK